MYEWHNIQRQVGLNQHTETSSIKKRLSSPQSKWQSIYMPPDYYYQCYIQKEAPSILRQPNGFLINLLCETCNRIPQKKLNTKWTSGTQKTLSPKASAWAQVTNMKTWRDLSPNHPYWQQQHIVPLHLLLTHFCWSVGHPSPALSNVSRKIDNV